jgi:universal stress protein E
VGTRIRTILVAVAEPSVREQPAVDRAAQLAQACDARVVLFHAAFNSALSGRPFFDSRGLAKSRGLVVAQRTKLLERLAKGMKARGVAVESYVVWEEPAHEAIIRAALREKADLVVAGRHARRADGPQPLRLTDWDLMRLCPRPLLLVRSRAAGSGVVLAALDPTHANDKPANLDLSIAAHADALAQALQVECHAVHCVPRGAYLMDQATPAQRKRVHARIQRLIKSAHAEMKRVHVVEGDVSTAVPALARKLDAQILAMGIVSRRWLKRFVIGDTAESLIRDVPCDLLLIKPDSFRLRLGRTRKEAIVLPKAK